jgi:hypothetical protein
MGEDKSGMKGIDKSDIYHLPFYSLPSKDGNM